MTSLFPRRRTWLLALLLPALAGCDSAGTATAAKAGDAPPSSDAPFFALSIDGAQVPIALDDIFTSYYPDGTLKIFAGSYRQTSLVLTVPDVANCPCQVPAGATDPGSELSQGAVSLQHYPHPGNGLNSWYTGQPGTPDANAIEITGIGTPQGRMRMISGRIHATVLKTESNGAGPENRDYRIEGSFRLPHEIKGAEGF